jgi:hypothetical protein
MKTKESEKAPMKKTFVSVTVTAMRGRYVDRTLAQRTGRIGRDGKRWAVVGVRGGYWMIKVFSPER